MSWLSRRILKDSKRYSLKFFLGYGSLSIALAVFFVFVQIEKSEKLWLDKNELTYLQGKVEWIDEKRNFINFKLNSSDAKFRYLPLYGKNLSQVEQALRNRNSIIRIGYDPANMANPLFDENNYYNTLVLKNDNVTVLSYERSQQTFSDDMMIGPWLIAFFFLSGIYLLYLGLIKLKK